ncbi:saponin hydrolase precursor [Paramyrothecium foliicola]|nr:saponin hydrolase precursor [Paramyrothecium foliicola]
MAPTSHRNTPPAMSQTPVHEDHHRSSSADAHDTVRSLSAFDADDGEGAPSPCVPLGIRGSPAHVVERIAFDPAFRNKNTPRSRGSWRHSLPMSTNRSSWAKSQEDVDSTSRKAHGHVRLDDHDSGYNARPHSSSIISLSTTSGRSRAHSPSHLISSTSSVHAASTLAGLQSRNDTDQEGLKPLNEEDIDPASFDLVAPTESYTKSYNLEIQSELLFSVEHLATIFEDPSLLQRFTNYLHSYRPKSVPLLIYYLDALKALKAIRYANALSAHLGTVEGVIFTTDPAAVVDDQALRDKAEMAFETLAVNDLPAFITQTYIQTVSITIKRRIANTLPPQLRDQSEGLAEVFCLTDPSRPDNPIVFASEEFHRTTQYGMNYVLGRNCRFLQGPKTNPFSVKRIRECVQAGKEHCETFLNYRRDGSPFMNLLMVAPLIDSRGVVRYHIGAQVDVSGLVKSFAGLESFSRLVEQEDSSKSHGAHEGKHKPRDDKGPMNEFRELAEMLNLPELKTVRESGGLLHRTQQEAMKSDEKVHNWNKPRLLISDESTIERRISDPTLHTDNIGGSGRLSGVYEHYLLVRPYPNLRVLFASPSLRVPGMLQSHFMERIGGSSMVHDAITQAFAEGNGITAKVRWTTKVDRHGRGRPRWIHFPILAGNLHANAAQGNIPAPPTPEPIDVVELPLPPVSPSFAEGACTADINPRRTGCIRRDVNEFQAGDFTADGNHVVVNVEFVGAPATPDPASVYLGEQLILVKADGTNFSNGDPWKCLSCGVPAQNAVSLDPQRDYPHAFRNMDKVLWGHNILECSGKPLASDDCTPDLTFIYPIRWNTAADGSGRGGSPRELRLHPDDVHLGWSSFTDRGGQNAYFGRLEFDPSPTGGEPLAPRYELVDVNLLVDPSRNDPITTDGGDLLIHEDVITVGELRGFSGAGEEILYIGYSTESTNIDVFAVHVITGAVRRLTSHPEYVDPLAFSHDNEWFVAMDTRGSDRQMWMSGMRWVPPVIDLVAVTAASSTRNNGPRRFFQPILIDRYGDRGDYFGQTINTAGDGSNGSVNDPNWNGRADPAFSPDGTRIVYWQALVVPPSCGGVNPLQCPESTAQGGREYRLMIAHLRSRQPKPPAPIFEIPNQIPWATPFPPGASPPSPKPLQPGNYTLQGKISGAAGVSLIAGSSGPYGIGSVSVTYKDYSDEEGYVLNGFEEVTVTIIPPDFWNNFVDWKSDIVQSGVVNATKKTSNGGFHLQIDALTNVFNATGTLTTTIDGVVYKQPLNGT